MKFNTSGTTDVNDIATAKLYYTGHNDIFSNDNLLAATTVVEGENVITLDVNAASDGEQIAIVSATQKGKTQYIKMTIAVELPTIVNTVGVSSDIESVTYYSVSGHSSEKPFDGVNIVVTRHTDGTVSTAKVVH